MNRKLLWKLSFIVVTGIVALFYLINYILAETEAEMSLLSETHQLELNEWGRQAEQIYLTKNRSDLKDWLEQLQTRESTWAAVVEYEIEPIAGENLPEDRYVGYNLGRAVDWQIHLYFKENPLMEIPFQAGRTSFLIVLPERMRPGSYWQTSRLLLLVFLPMVLLALLSTMIYRHIMQPLGKLERATRDFSSGDFSVRLRQRLGNRNDELAHLAETFDQMASRIGELIVNQRQLIADLSHEIRSPLARLELAVESCRNHEASNANLERIARESEHIRRLAEDTLTLAWLENERPVLEEETLDLVDLIDSVAEDASYEFSDRKISTSLPNSAIITKSNHRAVGQALENVVRNALRFTPENQGIEIQLEPDDDGYLLKVLDSGPGVPESLLSAIFKPFFRVDEARTSDSNNFGLGLALAHRQIDAVGGSIHASNRPTGGLCLTIMVPNHQM
ncbi:MAG: histidine kinase sensor domain-containing protein [Pseudomonadota bacterium]